MQHSWLNHTRTLLVGMLLFVGGILPLMAQDDTYNPVNPPEPALLYNITVNVTPDGTAYLSGIGQYTTGERVRIYSSARSSVYHFVHWLKNGEVYSTSRSFYYTVETESVTFTAVYEYMPESPSEPSLNLKSRLYLEASPEGACTFNHASGAKHLVGEYATVSTYPNQGFIFQGWYQGETLVSEEKTFSYLIPAEASTLTAKYIYSPVSPGDPVGGGQTNVDTGREGDVNGDKSVDVLDAVPVLNIYLNQSTTVEPLKADVNGDGSADVLDAVRVINIYLDN